MVVLFVPTSSGEFWLAVLWLLWAASIVWALTRTSFSLLFMALMIAMLLFVVMPATDAELFGNTVIATHNYSAGVASALKMSALGQGGMFAGAVTARTLWPVQSFSRIIQPLYLSTSRLDRAILLSISVGIVGVVGTSAIGHTSLLNFFVYATSGGYGTFTKEAQGNLGFMTAVQCVAGLALVLLPLRLGCTPSCHRFRSLLFGALATLILLGGGQRGLFFVPALAAGLVWLKTSKKSRPPRRVAALGAVLVLVIAGYVGVARVAADNREVSVVSVLAEPFGGGTNLFLPLAGLAYTVPTQIPYLDGASYEQLAVLPIPRALWGDKPQDVISTVTTAFDPEDSGLAFPEFGEAYANFGLPGVIASSLMLGGLIELIYRRYAGAISLRSSVSAADCGALLLDLFTRGDMAPLLTTFIGLIAAAALICRRRSAVLAAVGAPGKPEGHKPEVSISSRHG
jgi:oligosaccharide repeat unit polymerase